MIDKLGFQKLLQKEEYVPPQYKMLPRVKAELMNIIENDKSVLIYGDYDVDGLMCVLTVRDALQTCGVSKIGTYQFRKRMHTLDPVAIQECIQGHYDYLIVCDTGSSNLSMLQLVLKYNIKVIVLDHHKTMYSYDDFDEGIAIINTTLENQLGGHYNLSAGALCYTVLREVLVEKELPFSTLCVYAIISLYSDCISMLYSLNRAIYYESQSLLRDELPRVVRLFMNEYSSFNARYIGFWFAPRINAMFRSERLDLINTLFFTQPLSAATEAKCFSDINELYTQNRDMVAKITDIIKGQVQELDHFVLADLYSVDEYIPVKENRLHNYTGLVANKLSELYQKPAVVYCMFENEYKGSVRDLYGRAYLSLFQCLCYAGGHEPAFGIRIKALCYDEFMCDLERLDKQYSDEEIKNQPIVLQYPYQNPDDALIEDIAMYNEFSGGGIPTVLICKQIIGDIRERKTPYNYKYLWGAYEIQSNYQLGFGSYVLLKPFRTSKTKLLVQ